MFRLSVRREPIDSSATIALLLEEIDRIETRFLLLDRLYGVLLRMELRLMCDATRRRLINSI